MASSCAAVSSRWSTFGTAARPRSSTRSYHSRVDDVSQLLDELARAMSRPMPRSRAVRLLGVTVASLAVPALRPKPARAHHERTLATACHKARCPGSPPSPADPYTLLCKCNEKPIQGVGGETTICNWLCCDPKHYECVCEPGQATCKPKPCEEQCGEKCCREGEYCASPGAASVVRTASQSVASSARPAPQRRALAASAALSTRGAARATSGRRAAPVATTAAQGVAVRPPSAATLEQVSVAVLRVRILRS